MIKTPPYHLVHDNIRRLRRNIIDNLKREAYTYFICLGDERQEAVVVTLAAAEAVAGGIEGHAGDDSEVYFTVSGEGTAAWLHDAEGTGTKVVGAGVKAKFHFCVACDAGQEDGLAGKGILRFCRNGIRRCHVSEQAVRIHFVGQRVVEHDGAGGGKPRVCRKTAYNGKRRFVQFILGETALNLSYCFSKFTFSHIHSSG